MNNENDIKFLMQDIGKKAKLAAQQQRQVIGVRRGQGGGGELQQFPTIGRAIANGGQVAVRPAVKMH